MQQAIILRNDLKTVLPNNAIELYSKTKGMLLFIFLLQGCVTVTDQFGQQDTIYLTYQLKGSG